MRTGSAVLRPNRSDRSRLGAFSPVKSRLAEASGVSSRLLSADVQLLGVSAAFASALIAERCNRRLVCGADPGGQEVEISRETDL